MIDDHSRLAYSELHRDERAGTVTGFVERALAFSPLTANRPSRANRQRVDLRPQPPAA